MLFRSVSIAWAVGAAIYQRNADVARAQDFVDWAYEVCINAKDPAVNCSRQREKSWEVWTKGSWGNVAFASLAPIPLGWIAAYIMIAISRGALIGFRAIVPWATMSLWRRVKAVSGVLIVLVVVMFGGAFVLNLYVDTRVPVSLSPGALATEVGNDLVSAKGTWTREGVTESSKIAFPLQTSRIMCYREERRCLVATAVVGFGNMLDADLQQYEIESWSDTTIVFTDDGLCTATVYTIDRKTKSVNGVGHRLNESYCKSSLATTEESWSLHLTDGFKVYWDERRKARPLPLRLIQTLFGN